MQTITRIDGAITKATACQAARQEYARQFQPMAASYQSWHLFAVKDGLVIAPTGEHPVCLVRDAHAKTEQQVVNALCHQLDREGTPHLWIREP